MKKFLVGTLFIIALIGGYFYFVNYKSPVSTETGSMMEEDDGMMEEGKMMEENEISINLKNFSFTPAIIEAEAGETIKVKISNLQGFHDFVIDELDVASSQLSEGEEEVVEITIPKDAKSGKEYEFYCSVGNHRALGMVGVLRVK